jgi:citrate lyase subunit beta/citryl-CoA lyase
LNDIPPSALRSLLFVPADDVRKVDKALQSLADAVILDLEDAIAPDRKADARSAAAKCLTIRRALPVYVRVNAIDTALCYDDLLAVAGGGLAGIVLPKVDSPWQLRTVDWLLTQLERTHGGVPRAHEIIPMVETAKGVLALSQICSASPRVRRVAFGAADYSSDLGLELTAEEGELAFLRSQLVHWSRVAGIEPPIDTVVMQFRDADRFRMAAERACRLGFQGKLCIHPDQVQIANAVFTPSAEAVARAEAIIEAFRAAAERGSAATQVDGEFVDFPVVENARRVIARARHAGRS